MHRLNRDEQGRVKCVACFLCATACPAHCIDIVAAESPWPDRQKYPQSFTIDELRCIYCGMCEEACPVDAIELTSLYDLSGKSREEMIFDKEKLLSVYDQTKDAEPMPIRERIRDSIRGQSINAPRKDRLMNTSQRTAFMALAIILAPPGMWLMLPRGTARGPQAGMVLTAVGLGLWVSQLPRLGTWWPTRCF